MAAVDLDVGVPLGIHLAVASPPSSPVTDRVYGILQGRSPEVAIQVPFFNKELVFPLSRHNDEVPLIANVLKVGVPNSNAQR